MIKAIALDDEPIALDIVESFCEKSDKIKLERKFTSPDEALKYLQKFPIELIFLDINMPSISGIEFSAKVKEETMVVFTTAYSEYAVEGFDLKAIDYLLKPFSFERFEQAVQKAKDYKLLRINKAATEEMILSFRVDYELVHVKVEEINYIECFADYVKLFFASGKNLLVRITMKDLIQKLPSQHFMRVHRSYIINVDKVKSVRNKKIQLSNLEIPIGQSYLEATGKIFKQ